MTEEEQENAAHLTASTSAGYQEETKSKSGPLDQVYIASKSPNQPKNFKFPAKTFGSKKLTKRSFQPAWFERYEWLHYDETRDVVFCHICLKALANNMLTSLNADPAFTRNGFSNWKNATDTKKGFHKHESSDAHLEAMARYVTVPSTARGDIGELISEQHSLEKRKNKKILLTILSNIRYLARQALPLRRDWVSETASEENSNFHQLLKQRSQENPEILEWLQKQGDKFTSPVIQNEMLEEMALGVLRQISTNIQNATFFTIMADETADVSNKEQLVICIRWVDESFVVHEGFIGMHPLERTTADQVVAVLKNTLLRMNVNIQRARGQCYDGAATMAGEKTGVATQIKNINETCLYTHCYGHALNLAVADAIKSVKCISDSLETVREIGKLVKNSPQRNTKLDKIRAETKNESRGVHAFCTTRWTVQGEALAAVINNHTELMELWDWSLTVLKDTEMKARIRGVQSMMNSFNFYFGCSLGERLLKQTDNLSRALQNSSTSAAQGNRLAHDVVKTLLKDRNEASFELFWSRIL